MRGPVYKRRRESVALIHNPLNLPQTPSIAVETDVVTPAAMRCATQWLHASPLDGVGSGTQVDP